MVEFAWKPSPGIPKKEDADHPDGSEDDKSPLQFVHDVNPDSRRELVYTSLW